MGNTAQVWIIQHMIKCIISASIQEGKSPISKVLQSCGFWHIRGVIVLERWRLWKKSGWTLGTSRLSFTRQLSSANPSFFKCLFKYIQTKHHEINSCILDILTKLIFCGIHWTGFPRQLPVNNHKPRSKPTHKQLVSTLLYPVSLVSGCWDIWDRKNPNINTKII